MLDLVLRDPVHKLVRPVLPERPHEPVRAVLVDLDALVRVIQPPQFLNEMSRSNVRLGSPVSCAFPTHFPLVAAASLHEKSGSNARPGLLVSCPVAIRFLL